MDITSQSNMSHTRYVASGSHSIASNMLSCKREQVLRKESATAITQSSCVFTRLPVSYKQYTRNWQSSTIARISNSHQCFTNTLSGLQLHFSAWHTRSHILYIGIASDSHPDKCDFRSGPGLTTSRAPFGRPRPVLGRHCPLLEFITWTLLFCKNIKVDFVQAA